MAFDSKKLTPDGLRRLVKAHRQAFFAVTGENMAQHQSQEIVARQFEYPSWHAAITHAKAASGAVGPLSSRDPADSKTPIPTPTATVLPVSEEAWVQFMLFRIKHNQQLGDEHMAAVDLLRDAMRSADIEVMRTAFARYAEGVSFVQTALAEHGVGKKGEQHRAWEESMAAGWANCVRQAALKQLSHFAISRNEVTLQAYLEILPQKEQVDPQNPDFWIAKPVERPDLIVQTLFENAIDKGYMPNLDILEVAFPGEFERHARLDVLLSHPRNLGMLHRYLQTMADPLLYTKVLLARTREGVMDERKDEEAVEFGVALLEWGADGAAVEARLRKAFKDHDKPLQRAMERWEKIRAGRTDTLNDAPGTPDKSRFRM
jgi:hypothetical protein